MRRRGCVRAFLSCYALPFCLAFVLATGSLVRDARAGFERRYSGGRALGAAAALCVFGEDPWSFYYNPAHDALIRDLSIFYVPSVLGVSEIKSSGLAYRDNVWGVDIGGAAQTFGFSTYRENVFTLNLSLPLFDFLFIGLNANANHLFIEGYGNDMALSIDAGTKMFLSRNVSVGFSATNLNSSSETLSNDRIPQTFTGGIAFESNELNIGLEYFKELGFPSSVRIAAEYSPAKFFTLRAGSASGTNSFNAGISIRLQSFEFVYGASFHEVLGITQSFGISFDFSHDVKSEFEKVEAYRESFENK